MSEYVSYRGRLQWLLWPAWQYRVLAPLVYEQHLNAFQKAVLGLARAGHRNTTTMAELLQLHPDLLELVRDDLRQLSYLDQHGVVTERGAAAMKDGFLDPDKTIVTYVYQDPVTGTLWPASTQEPQIAPAQWEGVNRASVRFRTAGAPLHVSALPVPPPAMGPSVGPPGHEDIVEAVSRGERLGRRIRRDRPWQQAPPERVVARVSVVSAGQPVFLPVALGLSKQAKEGVASVTWVARNPFSGRPSTYLRRLVATQAQHSPPLRGAIDKLLGRSSQALYAEFDQMDREIRRRLAEDLEARFTHRIRDEQAVLELLTLLERDINRVRRPGDHTAEVADVVRNAWRLHEVVLRVLVRRRRVPIARNESIRERLTRALTELGLPFSQYAPIKAADWRTISKAFNNPDSATSPSLLAAATLSAAAGDSAHPFRRLAAHRRTLITDLTNLSKDRNSPGSHAGLTPLSPAFAELAWQLAQETVAAHLNLPIPKGNDVEA
ncbi:hypothetical protein [Nonomuraea jabiensis]|uniref:Uncharacterized protein n=1 Tax=Nonomuraea jabiensis TaxID=882448 RepID=A0A7W9FY69_9ACTN|nr:hypothetical protein [Nonomuraea jabiensis]MBB5773679.1 hypothetical protein [Nonomuraea jabiensis]